MRSPHVCYSDPTRGLVDPNPKCPNAAAHIKQPEGYLDWSEWADEMRKTHVSEMCPGCGLWLLAITKAEAKLRPKPLVFRKSRRKPTMADAEIRNGVRPKPIHLAADWDHKGNVSPACAERPRTLDLSVEIWCSEPRRATCRKCKTVAVRTGRRG